VDSIETSELERVWNASASSSRKEELKLQNERKKNLKIKTKKKKNFLRSSKRIYEITPKDHISTGLQYGTLFMISGKLLFIKINQTRIKTDFPSPSRLSLRDEAE
jgi:hypothetical protein